MIYRPDMRYTIDFSDVSVRAGGYLVILNSASHEPPRHPWNIGQHSHNSYEIHFIVAGSGVFTVGGTGYEVSGGDVVVTGPDILHAQTSGIDDPMEEFCVNVTITPRKGNKTPDDLTRLFDTLSANRFFIGSGVYASDEFVALLTESLERKSCWRERVSAIMMSLLIQVGRLFHASPENDIPPVGVLSDVTSRQINRRRKIDGYFREYLRDISEEELAKRLFVSRRQLSRIMREYYSMTFTEKLNDLRAEYAKTLLMTTDMTVAAIAESCGFSSAQYFYKVFTKKYGIPPAKLRRGLRRG